MTLLIIGVLTWSVVHFIPALAPSLKQSITGRLGENGYKGVFSLLILAALALIVIGWRSTPEQFVYVLPVWSRTLGFGLMIVAFLLIGAAHYPTRIKQVIRHPMLMGVIVWSIAHLLMNGTTRAFVLFGGLGIWALLEIILVNRREGAYVKPEVPSLGVELRGLVISGIIFVVVLFVHPYFTGVTSYPR